MIAYKGRQIVVHEHAGKSDYLLVTFSQLNSEHAADQHYFLGPQVSAGNISCVGVMTTEKNFYLSSEMEHVFHLVRQKRRGRPVVVFGQSMGGYAALKHSRALEADYVIALSPFYSMDPDDLELPSERHRKILMHSMSHHGVVDRPEFKGMGIKAADVSGVVAVLYDPSEFIDVFDANLIGKHLPQAGFVPVAHSGHVIYDASWDVAIIEGLIAAIRSGGAPAVGREMVKLRRNHGQFILRSLIKAANRKPELCARAIRSMRLRMHPSYQAFIGDPLNLRLIFQLASRGDADQAAAHFALMLRETFGLNSGQVPPRGDQSAVGMSETLDSLLLSCHGSFLAFDPGRGHVRFEPHVFGREDLLPVLARIRNGRADFRIIQQGQEKPVSPFQGLGTHFPRLGGPDPKLDDSRVPVELVALDNHQLALHAGDTFLGAVPTGEPQLLPSVTHQQRLVPLAIGAGSPINRIEAANWFDRTSRTYEEASTSLIPHGQAIAQSMRQGSRWRRLFNRDRETRFRPPASPVFRSAGSPG